MKIEVYHVLPTGETHEETSSCACKPRVDKTDSGIIIIHNSFDRREEKEFTYLQDERPDYYRVVLLLLADNTEVRAWRASDGDNEIYTVWEEDTILDNNMIKGWRYE